MVAFVLRVLFLSQCVLLLSFVRVLCVLFLCVFCVLALDAHALSPFAFFPVPVSQFGLVLPESVVA